MARDEAAPSDQNLKDTTPNSQNLKDTDLTKNSEVEGAIRGSQLLQDARSQDVRPSRSERHKPNLLSSGAVTLPRLLLRGAATLLRLLLRSGTENLLKMLLAAVIAIASALGLIVTIEWDGLQKETEFRSALIGDIRESVTNVLQSGYETAAGVHGIKERGGPNMARVKQAYHSREDKWKAAASRIAGQMEKLDDPEIGHRWDAYSVILGDYLRLSYPLPAREKTARRRSDLELRRQNVLRISAYLESRGQGKTIGPRKKDSLIRRSAELGTYLSYYVGLGGKLSSEVNRLIEQIRVAPTKIGPPTGLSQWVRERRFGADANERPTRNNRDYGWILILLTT